MDLQAIKSVAVAAAREGGAVLEAKLGRIDRIDKKGDIDLVTDADTAAEATVIECIRRAFPDHGILSEECGDAGGNADGRWVVDPLDGTTNFAHGIPMFAVSIGFCQGGDVLVGVVFNPVTRELFSAVRGQGAHLNGRPISVSRTAAMIDSLLVTGFPYNFKTIFETVIGRMAACLEAAQGIRRLGSAALDLCYVACGRFEGFWEQNLNPWDTAAGMCIALEAGGMVTDFGGGAYDPFGSSEILATNGRIHGEMIRLLTQRERDEDRTL